MIWMSMLRERGPSSSANRIDWKRPSESSPPLMPTATLRPRRAARRCEEAVPRSQSEKRGSAWLWRGPPAADPPRHAPAQQRGPEMRGGVAALAIGEAGIVVLVAGPIRHQAVHH